MEESKILSCAWMWSEGQGDTYVFPKEALLDFARELLSTSQQAEPKCVACEDSPAEGNNPCAVCHKQAEPALVNDEREAFKRYRLAGGILR